MQITLDDLTINFDDFQSEDLLKDWRWLIGNSAQSVLISSVGDAFLQDETGKILWLNTGVGDITEVAPSYDVFQVELQDEEKVNEWFLAPIVAELKGLNIFLKRGQCYSYKQMPIVGGQYEASNFQPTDLSFHFAASGQICFLLKDIPDGAQVNFTIINRSDQQ
jgi:hypothetical protein